MDKPRNRIRSISKGIYYSISSFTKGRSEHVIFIRTRERSSWKDSFNTSTHQRRKFQARLLPVVIIAGWGMSETPVNSGACLVESATCKSHTQSWDIRL